MASCHESGRLDPLPSDRRPRLAIAGNPNTGKTTLFNSLTGLNARVGNYPGVTVERRTGVLHAGGMDIEVMDVPGSYSLAARSREEELAITALLGLDGLPRPDLILAVVDATVLERNLYLILQLQELGLPTVVVLNLMDAAREQGIRVDPAALERLLGLPVVPIAAGRGEGVPALVTRVVALLKGEEAAFLRPGEPGWLWTPPPTLDAALGEAEALLPAPLLAPLSPSGRRALALWALMSVDAEDELHTLAPDTRAALRALYQAHLGAGHDLDALAIEGRYRWIDTHLGAAVGRPPPRISWTDRLDAVFTHPVLGFGIFVGLMFLVFTSLFAWADPAIGAVEAVFGWVGDQVRAVLGEGLFTSFLVEGIIGGVGSVLVFLPQILLLFFFITVLEGSGYMARAAFLMDRIMNRIGLHGRAFVPLLSGFACAIPAIMATRTMERERDRLLTMMAIPLMSCSARLPVYTLVIAALFPPALKVGPFSLAAAMLGIMYLFSTVMALVAAAIIGRTVLKGRRVPLLLELPPYRLPQPRTVARLMAERARVFVSEAGTVILVCTVVLWGLLTFPRLDAPPPAPVAVTSPADGAEEARAAEAIAHSWGGRMGKAIEPVIAPLGFDWRIGVGIIGAFAAREVFVSTMGIIYGVGSAVDEEDEGLRDKLRQATRADGSPAYTPLVGLSLMLFFALACQCMSTLAVLKRETGGYKWPAFVFVYMTALAWGVSFVVYQGGRLLGLG